jgi:hypothetical protein
MGVLTSEVGYTSATTGRGDHEVHKGHVVALAQNIVIQRIIQRYININSHSSSSRKVAVNLV